MRWTIVLLCLISSCLIASLYATSATAAPKNEIRVSAAASLTQVFKQLMADYQQQHPDQRVLINLASSGSLAKQIVAGAPCDLYISANPQWMDHLDNHGKIARSTLTTLTHNQLVCAGNLPRKANSLQDLSKLQRIALCSPDSSPAGRYAQHALQSLNLYSRLLTEKKLVLAKDVRQALRYSERQLVDAALIYASDAKASAEVAIWFHIPSQLYPPVRYPMALTQTGNQLPAAQQLHHYLQSERAQQLLAHHGFSL